MPLPWRASELSDRACGWLSPVGCRTPPTLCTPRPYSWGAPPANQFALLRHQPTIRSSVNAQALRPKNCLEEARLVEDKLSFFAEYRDPVSASLAKAGLQSLSGTGAVVPLGPRARGCTLCRCLMRLCGGWRTLFRGWMRLLGGGGGKKANKVCGSAFLSPLSLKP
jgi:hypothetical protein